jgi:hypothetical protein
LFLFVTILCFAGVAFSEPLLKIVGPIKEPVAAVQKTDPPTPGKLSKTVKLTDGQKKLLSGAGEFAIYGPREPISREQISSMREVRLKRGFSGGIVNPVLSNEDTISSDILYSIIGKRQKMVSDRYYWAEDFYSTAVTQSEVSSAVYGNHIVAGWNDFETYFWGTYSSISNWAVSHDGGKTFTAKLGLPTYSAPGITDTFGDPAVAVSPNGTFYFSTLCNYNDGAADYAAVCVYNSTDNGNTFNLWSYLSSGDINDFLDKPLMAVSPSNGKVYVTYTYFDDISPLKAIEVWSVNDTTTTRIDSNDDGLQGPIPAVGPDGTVYVAYEEWDAGGNPYIKLRKSSDSYATEVNVYGPFTSSADPDASTFCGRTAIKGNIRSQEFPSLAVDTRTGFNRLYIAFNARTPGSLCTPSLFPLGCLDIYLTRSIDSGATWSTPVMANPRPAGDESDKFFPWVTVNGKGKLGLVYYERKKTPGISGVAPNNWWITTTVRRFKHDLTLIDSLNVSPTFPVVTNNDYSATCYMGEYNSISANSQLADDNFYVFWGDNRFGDPDIQFSKIVPVVP